MTNDAESVSAVVDTNLFVSGLISKRGAPYQLIEALRAGAFTSVLSGVLREEYWRVLPRRTFAEKYGLTPEDVADLLLLVDMSAHMVTPQIALPVSVRDSKDEMVLAAALGGKADYLITGDGDLLALRDDPSLEGLRIVTVREFLEVLQHRPDR
jgi:uncharacterized protein